MKERKLFTSESVTEGHPDKIADQISDAVLDAILAEDPMARVACETVVNTGMAMVFGEVTTSAQVDIQSVVRETIREIGYCDGKFGYDADQIAVLVALDGQSPDIAQGVDEAMETRDEAETNLGAGDQGLMFGYACRETEEYMPLAISISHRLALRLAQVRKEGIVDYLGPDGKSQITVEYDDEGQIQRIDNIVISTQHLEGVDLGVLRQDIIKHVIEDVVPNEWLDDETEYFINPTGRFVIGGPVGDSGLTGRKIIVDTYGGAAHHGGGAFSGKDATKVDRSASYAARYVAKHIVAAGLADRCELQLAYAIGMMEPTSIAINCYGTSDYSEADLIRAVRSVFDLTPAGIIEMLDLRQPIYKQTAAYGHFGRPELDLSWERLDRVAALQSAIAT